MWKINRLAMALTLLLGSGLLAPVALGAGESLDQPHYTTEAPHTCRANMACAQVFVPTVDGLVVREVRLPLARDGEDAFLLVEVRNLAGSVPGDEVFARAIVDPKDVPLKSGYKDPGLTRVELVSEPGKRLQAGKAYALVVSSLPMGSDGKASTTSVSATTFFWYDRKQESYAGGPMVLEAESGGLWQAHSDRDFAFHITLDEAPNSPPVIGQVGPQELYEGDGQLTINLEVTDPDGDELTVTAQSTQPVVVAQVESAGDAHVLTLDLAGNISETTYATITVKASDGKVTSEMSFPVTAYPVVQPPTIGEIGDVTVQEGATEPVTLPITDPDGAIRNVAVTTDRPDLLTGAAARADNQWVLNLTASDVVREDATVAVSLSIDYGAAEPLTAAFTATVKNVNDLPQIHGLETKKQQGHVEKEDTQLSLDFWVSDEETPAAELTVTVEAATMYDPETPFFVGGPVPPDAGGMVRASFPFSPNVFGVTEVIVTVTDTDGGSQSESFTLTITEENDPPILHVPASVTIREDTASNPIEVRAEDPDGPEGLKRLTLTAVSSHPQLLPSTIDPTGAGIKIEGGEGRWFLTLIPKANQFGTATVTLYLRDGQHTIQGAFQVHVTPENDPPEIKQVEKQVQMLGAGTFVVPLEVSDLESFTHALLVDAQAADPSLLSQVQAYYNELAGRWELRITPVAGRTGETTVTVIADDGAAKSQPMTFTVVIVRAPAFSADLPTRVDLLEDQEPKQIAFTVTDGTPQPPVVSDPTVLEVKMEQSGGSYVLTLTPLKDQVGRVTVTLIAKNEYLESRHNITVEIANVNDPPVILNPPTDVVTDEDVPVDVELVIVDPDPGDVHTVKVEVAQRIDPTDQPVAQVTVLGTGLKRTLHIVPYANVVGKTKYRLVVQDSAGAGNQNEPVEFIVTVNPVDDPPVIHIPNRPVVDEDTGPHTFTIYVEDPDSPGPITLTAYSKDVPATLVDKDAAHGVWDLIISPAPNQSGDVHVTLTATSGGLTTEAVFTLHIKEINDPPVLTIHVVEDQTLEDTPYLLEMELVDPDTELSKLRVTAGADNATLLPPSSFRYEVVGGKPRMVITPARDQHGEAEVTITVSDGFLQVSRSFHLIVIPVPDYPRLEGVDDAITIDEDQRFDQQVRVYDPDVPGGPVSIEIAYSGDVLGCPSDDPCEPVRFVGTGEYRRLVIEPKPNASGEATITFTLTAGTGAQERRDTREIHLTVRQVNDPPEIVNIVAWDIWEDGRLENANVVVKDIDSDLGALKVEATSSNEAILKSKEGIQLVRAFEHLDEMMVYLTATPEPDRFGTVNITITVTDDRGLRATRSFPLVIKPVNDPPSFNAGPDREVDEDAGPQSFSSWAANISAGPYEQDQKLTFHVEIVEEQTQDKNKYPHLFATPPAVSPDGTLTFTTAPDAYGEAKLRVWLQDDGGTANGGLDTSAAQTFTIRVKPVNDPPVIAPIPNQGTEVGTPTPPIPLEVFDVETPTEQLDIWATSSDTSLLPNANITVVKGAAPTIQLKPAPGKIGQTTVTVHARDPEGKVGTTTFDLIVNDLSLSGLEPSVGTLTPAFDPRILSYTVSYSGWVAQVRVTAYAKDPGVRIRVDGQDVASGVPSQPVRIGENGGDVQVEVYAPATGISKPYWLTFVRSQSAVAELADLSITPGELQPKFDPERTRYTATVPYEVTAVTVHARPGDAWTKVTIDGNQNLRVGTNRIVVTVTAENGDQRFYYIDVTRLAGPLSIGSVTVEAGADWAVLRFETDDAASVTVHYTSEEGEERSRSGGYGRSHTVTLTGLEPATAYTFRIQAERSGGTGAELVSAFRTAAPEAKGQCAVDADGRLSCPARSTDEAQARQVLPDADPSRIAVAAATDLDMGAAVAAVLSEEVPAGERTVTVALADRPYGVALLDEEALRRAAGSGVAVKVESARGSVTLTPSFLADLRLAEGERLAVVLAEGEISPVDLEPWVGVGGYRQVGSPLSVSLVRIGDRGTAPVTALPSPLVVSLPVEAADEVEAATMAVFGRVSSEAQLSPLGGTLTPEGDRIEVAQPVPGSTVVLAYEARFSDVPETHWAYRIVHEMAARQVLRGVSANRFAPEQPITRGQLAAILARALNLGADDRFARIYYDISPYDPMAAEIGGAIRAGVMMGYPDGTFRPDQPVTRQELAVVLSRMASRLNLPGSLDREDMERLAGMADWGQVASWAQDGVRYAVAEGLMAGRSATTFAPLEQTTRAEAATVIKRLLDKVAPGEWR